MIQNQIRRCRGFRKQPDSTTKHYCNDDKDNMFIIKLVCTGLYNIFFIFALKQIVGTH